jgi:hypothetical protein
MGRLIKLKTWFICDNCKEKVFDVNGKLVFSELLYDQISKIEIGNLQKGIYFFTLNNLNAKLIKN